MGSISDVPLIKPFEYFVFESNHDLLFTLLSIFIYFVVASGSERTILIPSILNLEYITNRLKTIF